MDKNTVIELKKPELVEDVLTGVLRNGARRLLKEALEAEIESFIEEYQNLRLPNGYQRIVRNGYHKERKVQTGIGDVPAKVPRASDRTKGAENITFQSNILPPYLRKTKSIETLLPWLYLKGISTGDFPEALEALLGSEAKGLSASTVSRLKMVWEKEYQKWIQRDLSKNHYVYFWVDGIYCNVRMDKEKQCLLVIMGATQDGNKELVALEDGYRESEQSWKEILLDLKIVD